MKTENTASIVPFDFNGAEVRTIAKNGEPWFVATDVCRVLGYANPSSAVAKHCKSKGVAFYYPLKTDGGTQDVRFIPERDVYRLIMRSKLPAAEAFEEWVVGEVLPQIRKTGGYHLPSSFPEALRMLAEQAEETERLRLTVQEQAPAVEFVQRYVKAEGLFGIRETAKILELKQNFFVAMCIEKKVLFRENGSLQPYAGWIEKGYFEVKVGEANEHAFKQIRFTSKGLEWVRRYLDIPGLLAMAS